MIVRPYRLPTHEPQQLNGGPFESTAVEKKRHDCLAGYPPPHSPSIKYSHPVVMPFAKNKGLIPSMIRALVVYFVRNTTAILASQSWQQNYP